MLLKFTKRNKAATIVFCLIMSGLASFGLHALWPILLVILISILSLA